MLSAEWQKWPSLLLKERLHLPAISCIYAVATREGNILYVGKSANLRARWSARNHHRYDQLSRSRKIEYYIYWLATPIAELKVQEQYYIKLFKPELNNTKVKKHVPLVPLVDREAPRLLKVLSKYKSPDKTIRSVVIGSYINPSGATCILIANNIKDQSIIVSSTKKPYASAVRNSWSWEEHLCGRSNKTHLPTTIPTYRWNQYHFEFITMGSEWWTYINKNKSCLTTTKLLNVPVICLKDLTVLDKAKLKEIWHSTYGSNKVKLRPEAYIIYINSKLKLIE